MADDPFSCFDGASSSDDSSDDENSLQTGEAISSSKTEHQSTRDNESCGVLTFHANTESSLLLHVQNSLISGNKTAIDHKTAEIATGLRILSFIDEYCENRQWMMNMGPEKLKFLRESLRVARSSFDDRMEAMDKPRSEGRRFVIVEMGTYCGYSAIFMGACLDRYAKEAAGVDYHLYSVEVNPAYAAIATEMIALAGLEHVVTVILLDEHINAAEYVKMKFDISSIPFLVLDHDKDSYKKDLISFRDSGLVREGSVVFADNVIFAAIEDYVSYVKGLEREGTVNTRTLECLIEYADDVHMDEMKDGIEITTFLK